MRKWLNLFFSPDQNLDSIPPISITIHVTLIASLTNLYLHSPSIHQKKENTNEPHPKELTLDCPWINGILISLLNKQSRHLTTVAPPYRKTETISEKSI